MEFNLQKSGGVFSRIKQDVKGSYPIPFILHETSLVIHRLYRYTALNMRIETSLGVTMLNTKNGESYGYCPDVAGRSHQ